MTNLLEFVETETRSIAEAMRVPRYLLGNATVDEVINEVNFILDYAESVRNLTGSRRSRPSRGWRRHARARKAAERRAR